MNFMEALKAMREGKKVRRKEWTNQKWVFFFAQGTIYNQVDGLDHSIAITDYEGTDWEVVDKDEITNG